MDLSFIFCDDKDDAKYNGVYEQDGEDDAASDSTVFELDIFVEWLKVSTGCL